MATDFVDEFTSLKECIVDGMNLKTNESPGLDWLANVLPIVLHYVIYLFYSVQQLAISSLIFKKISQINSKNYRPISLTNTDYIIIEFRSARRLQKVTDKWISIPLSRVLH